MTPGGNRCPLLLQPPKPVAVRGKPTAKGSPAKMGHTGPRTTVFGGINTRWPGGADGVSKGKEEKKGWSQQDEETKGDAKATAADGGTGSSCFAIRLLRQPL